MQIAGKTVLITGGRRLGAVLAIALAERGANIALSYLTSEAAARETAESCRRQGVEAEIFAADLREPDQARRLIEQTAQRFGGIQVLVNLTSIYTRTPFLDLQPEQFHEALASNLSAPYWTAVAAAQQMLQQPVKHGLRGKILHYTDWAVDRPYRDFLPYLVAKGGLATMTRVLAVELAPTITINAIAPGTMAPPPDLSETQRELIRQRSALQRLGTPEEITRAALFLIEDADFMTGEILRLDGGRFLGPVSETVSDLD